MGLLLTDKEAHHVMGLSVERRLVRGVGSYLCQSFTNGVKHGLATIIDVELGKDVVDVILDCLFADGKLLGDLSVGQALGDQLEYLEFPGSKVVIKRSLLVGHGGELAHHLLGDGGSQQRLSMGHSADGAQHSLWVVVLEDVAPAAGLQPSEHKLVILEHRAKDHAHMGHLPG